MGGMSLTHTAPFPESRLSAGTRNHLLLLAGIMVLALGLRALMLGAESYWRDEIIMVRVVTGMTSLTDALHLDRPPVYTALLYVWVTIFGTTEVAVRSLSLVFSMLSFPLLYLLGSQMFTPRVGLAACFMMAVSEFHIYYAQEARYYGLLILISLLMILFYVRALRSGRVQDYVAFAVTSIALYHTHNYGLFQIGAVGLHYLLTWRQHRPGRKWWILSQLIVALVLAYPVYTTVAEIAGWSGAPAPTDVTEWLTAPSWLAPVDTLANFFFYDRGFSNVNPLPALMAAGVVLVVGTVVFLSRTNRLADAPRLLVRDARALAIDRGDTLLLLACWLVAPLAIVLLLSKVATPMYLDRYFSGSAPAFYLLLAAVVVAVRRVVPEVLSLSALVIIMLPFLNDYYTNPDKEQFREAAAFVAEQKAPDDVLAFADYRDPVFLPWIIDSFNWYYPDEKSACALDLRHENTQLLAALESCQPGSERAWVVLNPDNQERMTDLQKSLPAGAIERHGFYSVTVYSFAMPR